MHKEMTIEYRQKYAISGILLYVLSTVYIIYTSITRFPEEIWGALYWVIILFAAINAVLKGFVQETSGQRLFLYTLVSPYSIILSKIIYNLVLLMVICMLSYFAMFIFLGSPVKQTLLFFTGIFLGASGLGIALTFVAAVASRGSNQATLMAILGFPVIIPVLLIVLKLTAQSVGLINDEHIMSDIQILIGVDLLLIGLSLYLFPFLWKD